ncbi:MAG: hypothetical protein K2P21_05520 [Lachnospiraceae bacterium]|nr:hypothetical protein [Lachnospiraceae bacterium]
MKMRNAEDKITVEYHIFGKSKLSTACEKCRRAGRTKAASSRQERPKRKKAASAERLAAPDSGWRQASKRYANCMGNVSIAQTPT